MRITLELSHRRSFVTVPINHSSLISSLIYNVIDRSSSEYAERLHEQGYRLENRAFKLFTFSPLNPGHHRKWVMHENGTMSTGEKRLYLTISSPKEEFIEHLILGLLHEPFVSVGKERFRVETVRKLDAPLFSGDMRFVMLSPLVCATKSEADQYPQYLFPGDPDFKRVLVANLCRKYEVLHGKPIACDENDVMFELDRDYVAKVHGKVQKLITLKEGRSDESKVKGTLAPFRLVAPTELIEVGYECGFGEKNAQGFGMVKAIN
ncbi:CRISPR-associated protein Cas6 [Chlorobaculum parvum NCIB 8327]|uniref:CRISPR-associated endoribonuclease n=1 Tax=Chlorobaculum parvum (strain DSM 263 / NCIMB 8327) TaxID=517417 RepID=B3QRJ1_CHLP8|nr:CRISPR-associated endoribonuclease Cas6 [Chlorobaculum parvum]ACF10513.1 CRISPR-associated protein Cas6 [Chlorobaculum parvum NCIB 8327]